MGPRSTYFQSQGPGNQGHVQELELEDINRDDGRPNSRLMWATNTSSSSQDWNSAYTLQDGPAVLCTLLLQWLRRVLPRRSDQIREAKFIVQLQAFFKLSFEQFESNDVSFAEMAEDMEMDMATLAEEQQQQEQEQQEQQGVQEAEPAAAVAARVAAAGDNMAAAGKLMWQAAGAVAAGFGLTEAGGMGLVVKEDMKPSFANVVGLVFISSVHPNSMFKVLWDFLYLPINMWICLVTPVLVVFVANLRLTQVFGCVEFTVDVMCLLDVLARMRTAFISDNFTATTSPHRIARRYFLCGWGVLDLAACVPFLTLINIAPVDDFSTRVLLFRLLRLTKLLRLPNVLQTSNVRTYLQTKVLQQKGLVTLLTLLAAVLVTIHHAACYFYFIGVVTTQNRLMTVPAVVDASTGNVLAQSWVEEEELSSFYNFGRYIISLYWAMYTFLTVGYGDIAIVNSAEKIWAVITAITGVVMAGWFMGAVGTYMGGTGGREADILQRRQDVFLFIQKRHLRGRLASRLQHYEDSIMWRELTDSDRDIINGLPSMLRTEVVLHLYDKVVQKVLFMQTRPPQLVVELLLRLRLQLYDKNEYIIHEGEIGREIFFLAQGEVEVRRESPDEDEDDSGPDPSPLSIRYRTSSRFQLFFRSITRRLSRNSYNPLTLSVREGRVGPGGIIGRPSSGLGRLSRGVDSTSAASPCAAAGVSTSGATAAWSAVRKNSSAVSTTTLTDSGECSFGGRDLLMQLVEGGVQQQQQRQRQGAAAVTAAGVGVGKSGGRGPSFSRKYKSLGYIKAGGLFGHVSCMAGEVRRNSVVAVVRSEVLVLSREDAEELGKDWPDVYNDLKQPEKMRRRSACLNDTLPDSVDYYKPHPGGPVTCGSRHGGRAAGGAGEEARLGSKVRRKRSSPHGGGAPWCAQPATLGQVPEKRAVRIHRMNLVGGSGAVPEDPTVAEHDSDEHEGEGGSGGGAEGPGGGLKLPGPEPGKRDATAKPSNSMPGLGLVLTAVDQSGRTDVGAGQPQDSVGLIPQAQPSPTPLQHQMLLVRQAQVQEEQGYQTEEGITGWSMTAGEANAAPLADFEGGIPATVAATAAGVSGRAAAVEGNDAAGNVMHGSAGSGEVAGGGENHNHNGVDGANGGRGRAPVTMALELTTPPLHLGSPRA